METVGIVIVTFNRKELLLKNIQCLLNQTYLNKKIFIIDNCSNDRTYEFIRNILEENSNIFYKRTEENLGGAGGFKIGMKYAVDENVDCIWGMDDDAMPKEDALEKIMNHYNNNPNRCYWSNSNADNSGYDSNLEKLVYDWRFVGFFIPVKIVKKIGLPREDFFIYHDDGEYAHRIVKNKYEICKIKDSIIDHKGTAKENVKKKKFLFRKIRLSILPDFKVYYYVRNYILRYEWKEKIKYRIILLELPKYFFKVLFINKRQIKFVVKGYFDGIFNRSGKRVLP